MTQKKLPAVAFLASSLQGKVPLEAHWAGALLPIDRSESFQTGPETWTYGHYFQAVHQIISKDDYKLLLGAVQKQLATPLLLSEVQEVLIFSEKHGNLYHPAKIEVKTLQGRIAQFVMNVALTERGQAVLTHEVSALRHLTESYAFPWLPRVYFQSESERVSPAPGGPERKVSVFLADWLEGFCEFHHSYDPVDGSLKLILWDGNPQTNYLSGQQARQVYFQISKILTFYYNHQTYEQIFPWHHGAGDFVVKMSGKEAEVRLVTVRQYGALMDPSDMSVEEAMLFFFLNLSLRMRLDRLDGVGEIVWAGKECLDMTWEGFLEALQLKEKEGILPPGFQKSFIEWLRDFSQGDLVERFCALLESYDPEAPDLSVIRENLVPHIQGVSEIAKKA
ncbi:MAG: hypothetical protein C0407_02810 [Desulfobacca sp.]|nr:hypothetical protein [Desulfobacca sp.]